MPRNTSERLYEAVNQAHTSEVFIILLTVTGEEVQTPIRVTSDNVKTKSEGEEYIPFPFDITLHKQDDQSMPSVKLSIDAVDQRIVAQVQALRSRPKVKMRVVLSSDPDRVEIGPINFELIDVSVQNQVMTGKLIVAQFQNANFPASNFNPIDFPGLF